MCFGTNGLTKRQGLVKTICRNTPDYTCSRGTQCT